MKIQAPIIICIKCAKPLYHCSAIGREFTGALVKAEDFIPVTEKIPQPQEGDEMICPECGEEFFRKGDKGVILQLEGGAWWPHPPIPEKEIG